MNERLSRKELEARLEAIREELDRCKHIWDGPEDDDLSLEKSYAYRYGFCRQIINAARKLAGDGVAVWNAPGEAK